MKIEPDLIQDKVDQLAQVLTNRIMHKLDSGTGGKMTISADGITVSIEVDTFLKNIANDHNNESPKGKKARI